MLMMQGDVLHGRLVGNARDALIRNFATHAGPHSSTRTDGYNPDLADVLHAARTRSNRRPAACRCVAEQSARQLRPTLGETGVMTYMKGKREREREEERKRERESNGGALWTGGQKGREG